MKSISLENFIEERIQENRKWFTIEEVEFIKNNKNFFNKVYLLGAIDSRDCYK